MSGVRLNRFLARAGLASRRKCESIIADGRVTVGEEVERSPARIVDPARDVVRVDGRAVSAEVPRVFLLNKPAGVVTTVTDPNARDTVMDFAPEDAGRLYPAGRLDRDTTGLVLLTNDGELAFRITHPRFALPKRYLALVEGRVAPDACRRLEAGVSLDEATARVLSARVWGTDGRQSVLWLSLGEGRKRQIRRMCRAIGHPVVRLHRDAIGPLAVGALGEGACRSVTAAELAALRRPLGLSD